MMPAPRQEMNQDSWNLPITTSQPLMGGQQPSYMTKQMMPTTGTTGQFMTPSVM